MIEERDRTSGIDDEILELRKQLREINKELGM